MAGLAQIWTLTMIAYDRAMAIFYPLRREKRMKNGQVSNTSSSLHSAVHIFPNLHKLIRYSLKTSSADII